ncbi:MAG TPA: hypothetical protein PKD45_15245 [Flavobacteriales bacterium]|nr:hypothetical protein [Flavobacteriales bacterium]
MANDRYYIRSASGAYLACLCMMGSRIAFTWTDDLAEALNISTKEMAKSISDICNRAGCATLPTQHP